MRIVTMVWCVAVVAVIVRPVAAGAQRCLGQAEYDVGTHRVGAMSRTSAEANLYAATLGSGEQGSRFIEGFYGKAKMSSLPMSITTWGLRSGGQIDVPNATLVLVMGICSIAICALGPILGTIGLVMSGPAKKAYEANPGMYKEASFKNLNAGRICSIIGLCVGALVWIYYICVFIFFASVMNAASSHW